MPEQTVYHVHVHRVALPPVPALVRIWAVRAALLGSVLLPSLNGGIPQSSSNPVQGMLSEVDAFAPIDVYAPHYYDESPPGSYDFTLVDPMTDSEYVATPSPCSGTITAAATAHPGYGKAVILNCDDGTEFLFAHASELWVDVEPSATFRPVSLYLRKGQVFGVQGNTGNSTAPHWHVEITPPGGDRTNRALTEPIMEEAIAFWEAGVSPVAPLTGSAGPLLSDEQIKKSVGAAEGTVDWHTLKPDADYQGHNDPCVLNGTCPGRGTNKGYFSSDYGATPEEANAYQLAKLRKFQERAQAEAVAKFDAPLSQAALGNAVDLFNQSELAGSDFIRLLPTHDPTPQQIIDARAATYIDPATGQLDAPGLGNSWVAVVEDQARRTGAVQHGLKNSNQ